MNEENIILLEGFDEAIVGVSYRCGQPPHVVYDREKCLEILERDMSPDEAMEHFEFNIAGAWVGDQTPAFLTTYEDYMEMIDAET
jgi:hypothetical protein